MLLQTLFPFLPLQLIETLIYIVAALGIILITYGVFLETERRQDLVFLVGALCLFDYALYIGNRIFMIAMAGFALASLVEFIEILIGLHKEDGKHTLKKMKQINKQ
ncbi:MAG TPA: hypothetical protein DCS29_02085 [Candidatus Magasanikbacteria bacterium]|nr:MAG: hypothetical protein A2479_00405 [Candidatus Magasanikbacteria bacterium RIFOXYC2_FULL_39_8]HAT03545.1 hypothetical protein [Candidatus Magasanikbacteria bacterium]